MVVFVTDFGLDDTYAAELRAAAWSAVPGVGCVDGTHLVPQGDVLTAAYLCKRLGRAFGSTAVICAVVDPGVGGGREAVAVQCGETRCVAPDTGLVSYLWMEAGERRAVRLTTPSAASATFHGRDLFAPLAARLAAGAALADCGEPIDEPRLRPELLPSPTGSSVATLVVSVDHFGNCVTGLRRQDMGDRRVAELRWAGGSTTRMVTTYAQIASGLAMLWNSADHLELAAREASAAQAAGLGVGAAVEAELR
jgi:S-adenosyl-L-methionine hydrolase (adenosine-forming)